MDPRGLRRSGLRLRPALGKLERIQGIATKDAQELLVPLASLQTLILKGCSTIRDEGVRALASLTSLQTLNFAECDVLTNRGVRALTSLASLQELDLTECGATTKECGRLWSRGPSPLVRDLSACPPNGTTSSASVAWIVTVGSLLHEAY